MNTQVPFTMTPNSINVVLSGKMYAIDETHPFYEDIRELLKGIHDHDALLQLVDIPRAIEGLTFGKVTVADGAIFYNNIHVNNDMTRRILEMISEGFDVTMWALFMDNIMKNPIESAREELFMWLEKSGMPITPDGHFIAFKKVADDYTSYHTGPDGVPVTNFIGEMVAVKEEEVDQDRYNVCSTGLHFCSQEYLPYYYGSKGRVVILKINPADVRAIPSDYNHAKGRATSYLVVGELDQEDTAKAFNETTVATSYGRYTFAGVDADAPMSPGDTFHIDCNAAPDDFDPNDYPDFVDLAAVPIKAILKKPKKSKKTKFGGKWTAYQLLCLVKKVGSVRGTAKAENVSKSTMQDWVRKAKTERGV